MSRASKLLDNQSPLKRLFACAALVDLSQAQKLSNELLSNHHNAAAGDGGYKTKKCDLQIPNDLEVTISYQDYKFWATGAHPPPMLCRLSGPSRSARRALGSLDPPSANNLLLTCSPKSPTPSLSRLSHPTGGLMPLPDKKGARSADGQHNFLFVISFERWIVTILKFALCSMLVFQGAGSKR